MFPNLSTHDLQQRYLHTYLKINISGKISVDFVVSIDSEILVLKWAGPFSVKRVTITQEFPSMGLVNFNDCVHILSRRPLRQWSRGFKSNLIIDDCRHQTEALFHNQLSLDSAVACFDRVWIKPQIGLNAIRKKQMHSFAINNFYWFSGTPEHQYVWRSRVCIGEVLGRQIFFFTESSLLQEEINTDLRNIYAYL